MSDTTWAADLRRASHVQEAHITYAIQAAGESPLPPSWLGCAFDLPAELDADAFATALRGWTNRHETLRSQLTLSPRPTPGDRLQRMTLPVGAVSIHPVRRGTSPTAGSWCGIWRQCWTAKPALSAGPDISVQIGSPSLWRGPKGVAEPPFWQGWRTREIH